MTPRERVLTALTRKVPDKVPKDLSWGLCPALKEVFRQKTGVQDPEGYWDYFGLEVRIVHLEVLKGFEYARQAIRRGAMSPDMHGLEARFLKYFRDLPEEATITEWGTAHIPMAYEFTRMLYPMADFAGLDELEEYPFPHFTEDWRRAAMQEKVRAHHARDLAVAGAVTSTLFETCWQLRGMENLFVDWAMNPEFARRLLDRVTDIRCVMARILAESDVDILMLGDDVASQTGMLMSIATWREWLKGRLARIIRAAQEVKPDILVFYHCDGNHEAIIPDLIEIGVNILNPAQPECMDPTRLKAKYGDQLAFWGTMGIQSIMPFGTPDDVWREVKERIETVGRGGGLLIGPTHMLLPDVPWENILAFFEAVEEYGIYR